MIRRRFEPSVRAAPAWKSSRAFVTHGKKTESGSPALCGPAIQTLLAPVT